MCTIYSRNFKIDKNIIWTCVTLLNSIKIFLSSDASGIIIPVFLKYRLVSPKCLFYILIVLYLQNRLNAAPFKSSTKDDKEWKYILQNILGVNDISCVVFIKNTIISNNFILSFLVKTLVKTLKLRLLRMKVYP